MQGKSITAAFNRAFAASWANHPLRKKFQTPLVARHRAEVLEERRLLSAVMAPADPVIYDTSITGPLTPNPGHTFYASGYDASGNGPITWNNASAITPFTTNDLVMNVSPSSQTYSPCCEGSGGLGSNVLTNGITQTQIALAPNATSPAIGDGGSGDPSNNLSVVTGSSGTIPSFTWQLGTAGGATASTAGYDLSEIDLISGHQDYNTRIYAVDVLVEPVGSTSFYSLSGGQGFSLNSVPDGHGGTLLIDKGSAQLAIVNSASGSPMATNIRAVKLVIPDADTEFREFVVTGTASAGTSITHTPVSNVTVNTAAGSPIVNWSGGAGALGFSISRSTTLNGTYTAIGSVVGQQTFVDSTALPSSTYFYKVTGFDPTGSTTATSSVAVTTSFGATAYIFPNQFWQGTPKIIENLPQVNYSGANRSAAFPLAAGFIADPFSVYATGKITTDRAGNYTFVTDSDDDGYIYVNGKLVSANPGTHVVQNPTTTIPITLAANTSYNFVLLENQNGGRFSSNLQWQEPQADGSAGPLTLIPATNLKPTADAPPTPTQVTTKLISRNGIQVNWVATGDQSSYGYVVQRASSDLSGVPFTPYTTVSTVFSGPGSSTAAPPQSSWGATSLVDTSGAANTSYVYRVGVLSPGQTTPSTWTTSTPITLPSGSTATLFNGTLQINVGSSNDEVAVTLIGSNLSVTEGGGSRTGLPGSPNPIFEAPASSVQSVYITGTSAGYSSVDVTGAFNFPGPFTAVQVTDISVDSAFSASQITLVCSNNININKSITTSGPITLQADSDVNASGALTIPSGTIINSNGNLIAMHTNTLALSGLVNAGSGSVDYSVESLSAISSVFSNTTSSGTVMLTQTTGSPVNLSATTGTGITGTLSLYFPSTTFQTSGINTTAGNASILITATGIFNSGPISAGSGRLDLESGSSTLDAAVNVGAVMIPVFAQVVVDVSTMTVTGAINNAGTFIITPAGTVNCGTITGTGSTNVGHLLTANSFAQSAINVVTTGTLKLAHNAPAATSSTNALNVQIGGQVDLADNTLLINYGSTADPVATVRSLLASGYAGGAWNGTGLVSSDAAGDSTHATALGYADSADGLVAMPANSIEVKYTLYGDTGLTGSVGFTDFMRLTQHYSQTAGSSWGSGDFNYDGTVDANDFALLQANYGKTLPAPTAVPAMVPGAPVITVPKRPTIVSTPVVVIASAVMPASSDFVDPMKTKKTKVKSKVKVSVSEKVRRAD